MIALSKAKWKAEINKTTSSKEYYWTINCKDDIGILKEFNWIGSNKYYKSIKSCRDNLKKFAKINNLQFYIPDTSKEIK